MLRATLPTVSVLAVSGALASCTVEPDPVPEMRLTPQSLVATRVLVHRPETLEDTLGFARVTGLVAAPGGFWVADEGGDRLVRLNRALEPIEFVGRSGSGPGELEAPFYMVSTDDGMAVMELSNGRISVFDSTGAFRRTVPLPVAVAPFDWAGAGRFLVATGGDAYMQEVGARGIGAALAPRAQPDLNAWSTDNRIAVVDGGRIVVIEDNEALVRVFEADGTQVTAVRLPAEVVEWAERDSEAHFELAARLGARAVDVTTVKHTATQADGRVLILLSSDRVFGLLFDPVSMMATLLRIPEPGGVWTRLLDASLALVEDGSITVSHAFGLTTFALERTEP